MSSPPRRVVSCPAFLADSPGSAGALLAGSGVRAGGSDDDTRERGRSPGGTC
jgi:hypothetical protein